MERKDTADVIGYCGLIFHGSAVPDEPELAHELLLGWTTGADPHVARPSVGIGAGNPGGGTFRAVIFENGDGHAFSLTDDPFERVPEGGPDLTADKARAHEDLPFIWWVTDQVMQRDRRAWWMRHWLMRTTCIHTLAVFERREPILFVKHDAGDGGHAQAVLGEGTRAEQRGPAGDRPAVPRWAACLFFPRVPMRLWKTTTTASRRHMRPRTRPA